jgi:hypothetical protein
MLGGENYQLRENWEIRMEPGGSGLLSKSGSNFLAIDSPFTKKTSYISNKNYSPMSRVACKKSLFAGNVEC